MNRKVVSKPKKNSGYRERAVASLKDKLRFLFLQNSQYWIISCGVVFGVLYVSLNHYPERAKIYLAEKTTDLSKKLGFRLQEVFVFGRYRASQEEILQTLQVEKGQSLFQCDLSFMKENLEKLDWIQSVTIRRSLTGGLYIYLVEREPIAIYHDAKKSEFCLVDKEGELIHKSIAPCFRGLPVLSGEQAPQNALKVLQKINQFKSIRSQLTAMAFVEKRRWNLKINDTLEVKLPELKVKKALHVLNRLIEDGKLTTGDILAIDLRIEGKAIFKLSQAGKIYFKNYKTERKV